MYKRAIKKRDVKRRQFIMKKMISLFLSLALVVSIFTNVLAELSHILAEDEIVGASLILDTSGISIIHI
jgi:hypothetical protein